MSKASRAVIQISVALLLAVGAGLLMFQWAGNLSKKQPVAETAPTASVVVAKIDIDRGTKLDEEMLEIRQYNMDAVPGGSFESVEAVEGRVLSVAVGLNEAVTASKLADESVMGGGVSALIAPGMRAMSVKGNEVMGLAGFVRPGDRVDVLVAMTVGKDDDPVAKLVLSSVKVIATGTELTPNGEGVAASVDVYTLELTPDESERLALAASQGTLHFALRNELDEDSVLTDGSSVKSTLAAYRKPRPKPRPKIVVEVITGAESSRKTF